MVTLKVEGVSISAIARVQRIAWNTAARWLEKAADVCRAFNRRWTVGFVAAEFQADEIRSFVGRKARPAWMFVAIEVWSRLWPSMVTGRRSYRNTLALLRDVASRMDLESLPLIVTDGFEFYEKVVRRVFGPAVLYGQVLKTRRHDRVIKVERSARLGASWRFADATDPNQLVMFGEPAVDLLRAQILAAFSGRETTVQDVEEVVLTKTAFRETHYKRQVLAQLECLSPPALAMVNARPGRRAGTYGDPTMRIRFA